MVVGKTVRGVNCVIVEMKNQGRGEIKKVDGLKLLDPEMRECPAFCEVGRCWKLSMSVHEMAARRN